MKRLIIVGALLMLSGCVTNVATIGGGNVFTLSAGAEAEPPVALINSDVADCAYAAIDALKHDSNANGDQVFGECLTNKGVHQ